MENREKRITAAISIWGSLILSSTIENEVIKWLLITQAIILLCLYTYSRIKN